MPLPGETDSSGENPTLDDALREAGRLPVHEAATVLRSLFGDLEAAHDKGQAAGGFEAASLRTGADGTWKIAETRSSLTPGARRADLRSAGRILYRMLITPKRRGIDSLPFDLYRTHSVRH